MNRRTAVLGITAAAAVTAAVVVSLPHHHHETSRDAVSAYITQVNAVELQMQRPLSRVSLAYTHFTQDKTLGPHEVAQLDAARATLVRLRRRIAAVDPPPAAQKLRKLVVRLVASESEVTGEVAELAHFLPLFDVVLRELHASDVTFSKQLGSIHPPTPHALKGSKQEIAKAQAAFVTASTQAAAAQADVVQAYDTRLLRAVSRMRRLEPPPAFTPTFRAQIHALRATAAAGADLVAELRKPQRSNVAKLSFAFTQASRESRSVTAQRAEIAAIKAYNARVRAIDTLANAVHSELLRLQQTLP